MNLKMTYSRTAVLILTTVLLGCATRPNNNFEKNWVTIDSIEDFRELVDTSPRLRIWGYKGSDENFHYFVSQPGAFVTLDGYRYFRISKDEYRGIPKSQQETISWNSGIYSAAFSKPQEDGGWDHDLDRGLIEITEFSIPEIEQEKTEQAAGENASRPTP